MEPRPEAQARKVMLRRIGLELETVRHDEATFQEFQELFKLPLTPSKREAMNVLFPGRKQRGSGPVRGFAPHEVSLPGRIHWLPMSRHNVFIWNVRGLNARARRCVVSRQLWFALLSALGLQSLAPETTSAAVVDWWLTCRATLATDSRPVLDSVVLLITWCIWKEQNNRTFNRSSADLRGMVLAVLKEAEDWIAGGISTVCVPFAAWSQIQFTM